MVELRADVAILVELRADVAMVVELRAEAAMLVDLAWDSLSRILDTSTVVLIKKIETQKHANLAHTRNAARPEIGLLRIRERSVMPKGADIALRSVILA